MLSLTYNLSPTLKKNLKKIETLKQKILLKVLSPKIEVRLRWEAMVGRIYWSLSLEHRQITRQQVGKLLSMQTKKKPDRLEVEIINYKNTQDYLWHEWIMSPNLVTLSTLAELQRQAFQQVSKLAHSDEISHFFEYMQTGTEHPVVQAAIAQVQPLSGRISRLLTQLFLYKYGYNFRGLLVLEEYWRRDFVGLREAVQSISESNNLTVWLEYFTQALIVQLEKAARELVSPTLNKDVPENFGELNDRQKRILSIVQVPGAKITNKEVQKKFGVSQITASRDLSELARLGLLFAHGAGRSTYYTKA